MGPDHDTRSPHTYVVSNTRDARRQLQGCAWRLSLRRDAGLSLLRDVFPSSIDPVLRPIAASVGSAARSFATAALRDADYAEPLLAALDHAIAGAGDEYRAIAAWHDDAIVGLIVFGITAGALGAGRIYLITVDANARGRGVAAQLVDAACGELAGGGTRFAMIELPGEPRFAHVRRLAVRMGFREEGRVDDYHREGVPLLLLRRDLLHTRNDSAS
jgi:ribosomal protein S18 acetylase RimI-like enzyme